MMNQNGNVLVYILLAIALLAALTYTLTSENRGSRQNQLTEARAKLLASDLIKHATSAKIALQQMTQWGVTFDEVRFDLPGEAGFTANTGDQIYHPSGGGLAVFQVSDSLFDDNGTTGWAFQGNVNVGWSATSATDLIISFINLDTAVCEQVNQQLHGNTTIPVSTVDFDNTLTESATDDPLIAAECSECENVDAMCISDGTTNAFYTLIGMR